MPKDMFFNISEEKRQLFLNVAKEEFTTKSFEQVSVNSIVKKTNISRGSFYTYFTDLEELFNYLFTSIKVERMKYAKNLLKEANGNYFAFIKNLFAYDFDAFKSENQYTLFRNYIHYIQFIKKGSIRDLIIEESMSEMLKGEDMVVFYNLKQFNISPSEFLDVIELIVIIMINTFLKSESENLNKEQAITLFNKRMSYLENGLRNKD